ncbi:MAG: Pvc16 family protein [Planctomycetota bacterium]
MGPSIYELSRWLAALLEKGIQEPRPRRPIPVLLCHPLDPFENPEIVESGTVGVLYPVRVSPETRLRQSALAFETEAPRRDTGPEDLVERLRFPGLWVRVRYVFLAAGGSLEDQLGAIEAALRTLHDNPTVRAPEGPSPGPEAPPDAEGAPREDGGAAYPVRILEDAEGWRELGLGAHALAIAFEVTVPIASSRTRAVPRVVERKLEVEEEAP